MTRMNIASDQFKQNIDNNVGQLIDLRTSEEFNAGHIPGATNIDIYQPDFKQIISQLDKTQTYLIYCASGSRSAAAQQLMESLGFVKVLNLEYGFGSWLQQGFPSE